jgi:hypothetical protein
LGAHGFHEIAGKAIASGCIDMEHAYARIETKGSSGQPGFGFEKSIQIIKDGVWRVDRKTGRPGYR